MNYLCADGSGLINNDLYQLDLTTLVWSEIARSTAGPPAVALPGFAAADDALFVFGGAGSVPFAGGTSH